MRRPGPSRHGSLLFWGRGLRSSAWLRRRTQVTFAKSSAMRTKKCPRQLLQRLSEALRGCDPVLAQELESIAGTSGGNKATKKKAFNSCSIVRTP